MSGAVEKHKQKVFLMSPQGKVVWSHAWLSLDNIDVLSCGLSFSSGYTSPLPRWAKPLSSEGRVMWWETTTVGGLIRANLFLDPKQSQSPLKKAGILMSHESCSWLVKGGRWRKDAVPSTTGCQSS